MPSTWRSTRASSSAISRPGRLGERVLLPAHHHGPGPVGRRHDRAGGADHGRREPRRGGAAARPRERRDPADPARADAPAHRGHARAVHLRRQRRVARARGVDHARVHAQRVRSGDPRLDRRRPHGVVRLHVRGQRGPHRAHQAGRSKRAAPGVTPRERRVLLAVGAVYAAVVIPIGVHKGGDFTQELEQSERLLRGLPLYDANPEKGIWWPPFTALGLVPFALVARSSLAVAKVCWAALNVCCLGWALVLARRWTTGWRPIVLAVAAVGKPLQSNFEHLNVTPILLGLIVATAAELEQRREARAGGWLGLATAIKGFPALVFLYFLVRRRWRGLAAVLARSTPDPARREIWRWALLGVAGILTSGVLTFGLYPSWLWFIGQANYTWGSLLLLAALVIERVRRPVPVPSPT